MSAAAEREPDSSGFSPRVVLALLLAGVFAAAAFLVLSAYAPDLKAGRSGSAHALSTSAIGYAGVVRLLEMVGQPVVINRYPGPVSRSPGLMVLTPEAPGQLKDLPLEMDRLIVLPKWYAAPDPDHPGWEKQVVEVGVPTVAGVLPKSLGGLGVQRRAAGKAGPAMLVSGFNVWPESGLPLGPVQRFQTMTDGRLEPVVNDDQGNMVVGMAQGGHVYVLSDPDLLNTQGIADPRTARVAATLMMALRDEQRPIAFDVSLDGIGDGRSILKLALEPPFLGVTLCLLAVAALVGAQGWSRFGPARRPGRALALGKTALVDNGASMIRLAKREPKMALRYVRLCRRRAAAALGAANLEDGPLDDFLDRWAGEAGAEDRISVLTAEAAKVKTTGELVVLARRARRWRLEMMRESG